MQKNKNNKKSKLLSLSRDFFLVLVVFSLISYWQVRNMLASDGSVQIEQQLILSLNGEALPMLASDKPTLVYFFAPWCKICALSIGNLTYLNPNKVKIVVIALDYSTVNEVEIFTSKHEISASVFLGTDILKSEFNIQGYPSYYLIDSEHKVVSKSYGYSSALGLKLRELFGSP